MGLKDWFVRISGALLKDALTGRSKPSRSPLAQEQTTRQSERVRVEVAEPMSSAVTDGVRVIVQSMYLPDQSSPDDDHYVFAYTVAISNESEVPAQLVTRHWIITDANGDVEEVQGEGVVGKQPRLLPGEAFQYTSGCALATPVGTMHGTYQMVRDDGTRFDAAIAPFTLASPLYAQTRTMN